MKIDYLIIGQGLAGSILAWQLMQQGKRVLIVDNGLLNASQVAAGLINPVTGKRLVKTANTTQLLHCAVHFYQQMSAYFGQPFYIPLPMQRIIANDAELQYCQTRLKDSDYQNYLTGFIPADRTTNDVYAPFGVLVQKQTGYLLCKNLLQHLRDFFIARHSYRPADLRYQDITIHPDSIAWQDIEAQAIIFCEGYHCHDNPWFNKLPLQPVKGEILTMRSAAALAENMINYGRWMIPVKPTQLRTGATYQHGELNSQISDCGKQSLLQSLRRACPKIKLEATIEHLAGIRPCTLDKQPFIGFHPSYRRLSIFNGFGSKGSLQIPFYAQSFCSTLLSAAPLPPSVDISRYHATHFPD